MLLICLRILFADAQSPLVAPEVVDTASEIDRQVHNLVGLQFTPEQTKIVKGLLLQQNEAFLVLM